MQGFKNVLIAIKWFRKATITSINNVGARAYRIRERVDCSYNQKLDEVILEPVLFYKRIERVLNERLTERQKEILLSDNHREIGLKNRRLMQNKQHEIRTKLEPWFIKDGIIID